MAIINYNYVSKLTGIIIFLFIFNIQNLHARLPEHEPVPGGVLVVPLSKVNHNKPKPKVWFNNRQVTVVKSMRDNRNLWHAIVGVPIDYKPGNLDLKIQQESIKYVKSIEILPKDYPVSRITLKDDSKVTPPSNVLPKIQAEAKKMQSVLKHWDNELEPDFNLDWPVTGRISDAYGKKRIFNGKPKAPHNGLDIAVNKGTPIQAPTAGKVALVGKDYYYCGNMVILEHGQGFKTLYCHMDTINVQEGQKITKGKTIGTVGSTGRATGPHLHFGVSLNDAKIKPNLFLPKQKNKQETKLANNPNTNIQKNNSVVKH